jgi:hypothetical protein
MSAEAAQGEWAATPAACFASAVPAAPIKLVLGVPLERHRGRDLAPVERARRRARACAWRCRCRARDYFSKGFERKPAASSATGSQEHLARLLDHLVGEQQNR